MKKILPLATLVTILVPTAASSIQNDNPCADKKVVRAFLENSTQKDGATCTDVSDITTLPPTGKALLSCHGTFITSNSSRVPAKFTFNMNSVHHYYFTIEPDD